MRGCLHAAAGALRARSVCLVADARGVGAGLGAGARGLAEDEGVLGLGLALLKAGLRAAS